MVLSVSPVVPLAPSWYVMFAKARPSLRTEMTQRCCPWDRKTSSTRDKDEADVSGQRRETERQKQKEKRTWHNTTSAAREFAWSKTKLVWGEETSKLKRQESVMCVLPLPPTISSSSDSASYYNNKMLFSCLKTLQKASFCFKITKMSFLVSYLVAFFTAREFAGL